MGLSYQGTFGPHFFEDDEGKAETVKTANYIAMLRGKFIPILKRKKILGICHFQQDGAPLIATMRACPGSGSNWGRESSPGRLTLAGLHTAQTSIQLIFFFGDTWKTLYIQIPSQEPLISWKKISKEKWGSWNLKWLRPLWTTCCQGSRTYSPGKEPGSRNYWNISHLFYLNIKL